MRGCSDVGPKSTPPTTIPLKSWPPKTGTNLPTGGGFSALSVSPFSDSLISASLNLQRKVMKRAQGLGMLLMLISLVSTSALAFKGDDFSYCESIVRKWAESSTNNRIKEDKLTLKDLLFFLHVPRTGGRSYYHCFLKKLYVNIDECPRSYDKLRFDPRESKCRLLVTHDDYSLVSKLSNDKTSVVTILRNPIDRIFSTYEFSVEVAARFLVHPNLTSAIQMSRRMTSRSHGVSTLEIWPWKYLVPWMREDLFARRDARKYAAVRSFNGTINPYDMNGLVMPLHSFVDDPMAHEIIHNGATFQVAGLTNNSFLAESAKIRHCVRRYSVLGHYILKVAKSRLDHMLYIGLTEDHKESATIFANMVGSQILSQTEALSSHGTSPFRDSEVASENHNQNSSGDQTIGDDTSSSDFDMTDKNMTVEKLMEAYEMCTSNLRKSQAKRRTLSLRKIAPANFSKEARLQVPPTLIQKLLLMNRLDVDLYNYAQNLFMEQQKHLMQIDRPKFGPRQHKHLLSESEMQEALHGIYAYKTWKVLLLVFMTLLFFFVAVIVTTRRKTLKVKV
ncbi:Protein-tyrosine sulfotransferase [Platanthera guangdongensis]|uniref:Protein-tyrosine sulfotransferase n=1 Tax=Platanthera guangdongensis TaxID=2320717 RepID=A0ABR2MFH0_9ASPA